MATRISPSQLDFDTIKESLKEYFRNSGEFADYNFEGSGLSAILDVLAYDTHLKALVANFSLNEAFLDTAQLRSSVVSHAKSLNYLPSSMNSAQAILDVSIPSASGSLEFTLPKYTKFSSTIDNVTYSFYTLDDYETNSASNFVFSDVEVYEGTLVKKRFIVDADTNNNPTYVIPDENLYVGSISINIRDGLDSDTVTSYRRASRIEDFAPDQEIYFIAEAANGYYELTFGDGIVGLPPSEGSIIEVTYLSTNGPDANDAASFSTTEKINAYTIVPTTVTPAFGGAMKESIESIRFNAPKSFAAQDRAVTESDFVALIQNSVSYIESINVYGGQRANPPQYGKVFICIKPIGADALNDTQKTQLLENTLNSRVILSITPELVDPTIQYLSVTANVVYNPAKTIFTRQQLQNQIKNVISEFGTENLLGFQSPFRKSQLTAAIDDYSTAILSSDVTIRLQKRFIPELNTNARYDLEFTQPFASVTSDDYILTSDEFQYTIDGVSYNCRLRNKTGTSQLEIYTLSGGNQVILVDDAGYIDSTTNTVTVIPFKPSGISDGVNGIRVFINPASQLKISPDRNILLRIDDDTIAVTAIKDE